jgi:uncharacterized protein YbgA (DUF1722 family)/uncharacterized protein YbbK (DUF523 family)
MSEKIKVGVSSCLLGEAVRYNGGHKKSDYIAGTLDNFFDFVSYCPEVDIGLGIPRPTIRLIATDRGTECVGSEDDNLNVTDDLLSAAQKQDQWLASLSGYIFKKDSPSCGMERVRLYRGKSVERKGVGIFAQYVMDNFPLLPVEEEGRLNDLRIRENFIRRVYMYREWQTLLANGLTKGALQKFHGRLKYVLYSHNQHRSRELGRELAQLEDENLQAFSEHYISEVMAIMRQHATRKNHVNVLQHLQGYLKQSIDSDDKQRLVQAIKEYHRGITPLVVPLELLRFLFSRYPHPYIEANYYFEPYPKELSLLNHV